jgi:hypothetical protein
MLFTLLSGMSNSAEGCVANYHFRFLIRLHNHKQGKCLLV